MELNADLGRPQVPANVQEKYRYLVLSVASVCLLVELFVIRPPFLIAIFNYPPSAVIQRGGRVRLFSVPHGKLAANKSYI